ncbi:uncharacterized protein K444DRAFT_624960 [Hyaloscypha bicolor E]|uniref:Uncharacterized protein n=1 Tax=Hyaloscypha bicolor E TaxID=1095630 RepID=A0A2J6TQS4_9HELO|nr:uncharacterized protein K444DRAFT_624960 [Hyaloscypha bicolor E]PMD65374.1 hypothetical protein K444DRAFT_624960 [Hyaloscypha bicolor E]
MAIPSDAWVSGILHELTEFSKLRSLTILNEGRPTRHRFRVLLNHKLFLQAITLKSLPVYFVGRDIVALINALSDYGSLKEIQIRIVRDYKDPKSSWYRPLVELGGGWRKLLLGAYLSDVRPEDGWNEVLETVSSRSCDIKEIGLPCICWGSLPPHSLLKPLISNPGNAQITINQLRNLRVMIAGYHKYILNERITKPGLGRRIFKAHRKEHVGLYVGIPHAFSSSQNPNTTTTGSIRRSEEHHDGLRLLSSSPRKLTILALSQIWRKSVTVEEFVGSIQLGLSQADRTRTLRGNIVGGKTWHTVCLMSLVRFQKPQL